jgi:hypothetical protein
MCVDATYQGFYCAFQMEHLSSLGFNSVSAREIYDGRLQHAVLLVQLSIANACIILSQQQEGAASMYLLPSIRWLCCSLQLEQGARSGNTVAVPSMKEYSINGTNPPPRTFFDGLL